MPDFAKALVLIGVFILTFGTLWRLLSYHAIASPNPHLAHIGLAMATQY